MEVLIGTLLCGFMNSLKIHLLSLFLQVPIQGTSVLNLRCFCQDVFGSLCKASNDRVEFDTFKLGYILIETQTIKFKFFENILHTRFSCIV